MNGCKYGQVHKKLWRQVGLYGYTKEKHECKQVNVFSGGSWVGAPVYTLKGHCVGYAEK